LFIYKDYPKVSYKMFRLPVRWLKNRTHFDRHSEYSSCQEKEMAQEDGL